MMKTILTLAAVLSTGAAFACSCMELPPLDKQLVSELKHAYRGTIIEIIEDSVQMEVRYKLLVSETYIGEQRDTIEFTSAADVGICGINTHLGDKWILTWDTDDPVPRLSICCRVYDFSDLRKTKRYFRFRFNHDAHKSLRKKSRRFRFDERMLRKAKS